MKKTKPEITGSVTDGVASGQITDKYIDYNAVLAPYGLSYNLNDKLTASYVVTENGEAAEAVPFNLNEDGSYSFDLSTLNEQSHNIVTVFVQDAAGNIGQQVIFESENLPTNPETPEQPGEPTDPEAPEQPGEADRSRRHQNNQVNQQIQHQSNQIQSETPEQPGEPTNPETPQQLDTATKSDMRLASTKPIKFAALEQDLVTLQNATEIAPIIETTTTPSIEIESLPNLTLIEPIFN